jgi:hypothetical protein
VGEDHALAEAGGLDVRGSRGHRVSLRLGGGRITRRLIDAEAVEPPASNPNADDDDHGTMSSGQRRRTNEEARCGSARLEVPVES